MVYNGQKEKMKRFIMLLLAFVGLSTLTMAQTTKTCNISGQNDKATVVASIIEVGTDYVTVELENDGTDAVNVTVSIIAPSGVSDGERSTKVYPQSSKTIKIPTKGAKPEHNVKDYKIRSLSGSRCN